MAAILYVDKVFGNRHTSESYKGMIQVVGHSLDTEVNGMVALDKILRYQYDLVYMGMEMHDMGGLEFLQRLRDLKQEIPVVVCDIKPDRVGLSIRSGYEPIIGRCFPMTQDNVFDYLSEIDKVTAPN
ncbi:response regulator [Candidatus Pacearchaeota archaeon]|nr:response regulator [Candidatus Pacearchaeota archaeon]